MEIVIDLFKIKTRQISNKKEDCNVNKVMDGRLTIAQKLIPAMGGEIRTKTKKENRKDTFFNIPLEVTVKKDKTSETYGHKKIPAWDDYKLLIAEDIESNYVYLKEILKSTNIQITWARKIKELNRDISIVIQTAYSPESEPEKTLARFDEFLTKPIWSNDLIRMLSRFLHSSERTKEYSEQK